MDIVIPLGTGSKWNNNELRYALRSLDKNVTGYDKIFIVGEDPGFIRWTNKIIHLSFKDNSQYNHEKNIYDKIAFTCRQSQISDDFFFSNDDIFFILEINISEYPYFYKGDLKTSFEKRPPGDIYRASLKNSYTQLVARKLPTKHFDVHFPIIYNKKKFLDTVGSFDWALPYGSVIKSLYCNSLQLPGAFMADCKIDKKLSLKELDEYITGRHCFSLGDKGITSEMKLFLKDLFPAASRFEISSAASQTEKVA